MKKRQRAFTNRGHGLLKDVPGHDLEAAQASLNRNYSVERYACPHPGPLPRGEGETLARVRMFTD